MKPSQLIRAIGPQKLEAMLADLPRRAQRAAVKEAGPKKRKGLMVNPAKRRQEELAQIKQAVIDGGEDAADALFYGWLTSKRWPMLADFLDTFHVKHRQGLTNDDLDFLKNARPSQLQTAVEKIASKYGREDAAIYVHYLQHKNEIDLMQHLPDLATVFPEPPPDPEKPAEAAPSAETASPPAPAPPVSPGGGE
ncbi:MAG TPA: hypothetical protein VG389_07720 [Myxococcota bacterium]|jgi:hypothetical protein|nr:hypothetical protein [Myxococcota bacterium]